MSRFLKKLRNFWRQLGPGLITGAAGAVEEEVLHQHPKRKDGGAMIPGVEPHIKHRSSHIIKNEISVMYKDVRYGMVFSNLITYFIIILCAFTLFRAGAFSPGTVEEIASALRPMAGPNSNFLFLLGILAAGTLAIPVLAGSAAYALSEMFGWRWASLTHSTGQNSFT